MGKIFKEGFIGFVVCLVAVFGQIMIGNEEAFAEGIILTPSSGHGMANEPILIKGTGFEAGATIAANSITVGDQPTTHST
ncbi:MAG: hypothetical protein QME40_05790, partial [bacterium]|nr:hypothetical protein [bacterium]